MTDKEMLEMQGVEFTYVFPSGKTMKSYVKKVDVKTGMMSCWSFSLTTDCGTKTFTPENEDEEREGACCVIGTWRREATEEYLQEIKDTGKVFCRHNEGWFEGCPL